MVVKQWIGCCVGQTTQFWLKDFILFSTNFSTFLSTLTSLMHDLQLTNPLPDYPTIKHWMYQVDWDG
jgi:hypothetical protein